MTSLPYRIIDTNNKHSRAVFRDGEIIIRLAKRLNAKQREEHIKTLYEGLSKKIQKQSLSTIQIDPFADVIKNGIGTIAFESGHVLKASLTKGNSDRIDATDDSIQVRYKNSNTLHRLLWRAVSDAMKDTMWDYVHDINERTYKATISEVRLRAMKSRWGSCSTSGVIMLNTALLFLPHNLLEYVIIHELAHRLHHNHSPAFWAEVERFLPDYKKLRREIRQYEIVL